MRIVCNPDLMDIMLLRWFFNAASSWNFRDSTLLLLVQGFTISIYWFYVPTSFGCCFGWYVVPTGRVKVPAGRYVVPTGKDNVIVSAGRSKVIPVGRTILVLVSFNPSSSYWANLSIVAQASSGLNFLSLPPASSHCTIDPKLLIEIPIMVYGRIRISLQIFAVPPRWKELSRNQVVISSHVVMDHAGRRLNQLLA
ncbi:hypothetical protein Tco_0506592 [Tanacetum coccineum]